MKRYRAVDVPPKFRRTAKGRNTRLGDSVYFSRFFSAYNLVYLKFFLMWVCCIALDFLIGFRFELLWPVWLLVRHLYESFRVHAFSSSLHYSAFSVFFVCVTATSDLVCYLFIPIQVLIFLASTYVWVQFVYQSSDRGVCLPSLFLWALFIVFEYSVRYRFDNATWYLTRTSWITAGLFPSTADSVSIGLSANSSSSSSTSSTRLELYRPFAAHCIGFPVVTLGFRVKSFFSNWRMRVRREEVKRQNEFFERLLADAIPTSFENRKHFISSRSNLAIDPQEVIDNVTIGLSANSSSSSSTASTRLELYRPFAAHCIGFPVSTLGYRVKSFLSRLTPSLQRVLESAIAQLTGGGTGPVAGGGGTAQQQDDMISTSGDGSNVADEEEWDHESVHFHQNICTDHLGSRKKSKRSRVVSSISQASTIPTTTTTTTIVATAAADVTTASNFISSSGHSSLYNYTNNNNNNNSIIKLNGAELNGHCGTGGGVSGSSNHLQHHHQETDNNHNSTNECALLRENAQRLSEIRQLQKERQTLELSLDKMKVELKSARSAENELRVQLKNVQQREQSCREEWKQFEREQKQRVDQLESKCKQLAKQNDYYKMNTQALERRVGELQLKKSEVERELTNERLRNSTRDEPPVGRQQQQHNNASENGELKQKMANQDRELKALRKDLKAKNEQCNKFDDELRQLRSTKTDENKQMDLMREKNLILEQTLSAENKLKQDLFRALNDSKAEIATLKARLYPKQTNKEQQQQQQGGGGPSNGFHDVITSIGGGGGGSALFHSSNGTAGGGGLSSSSGSSPTILQQQQHHQRQFSSAISQQKSLTPPPLSVGSSTFNPTLEQLLQATQNMSYSLSPLNSNGGMNGGGGEQHDGTNFNSNGTNNTNSNGGGGSSPFSGTTASDMLAVGGHRSVGGNAKTLL